MNHCPMTGREALERLLSGNQDYLKERLSICPTKAQMEALKDGQHPFAAIVACADSRVPPNLLFNCSLGEIFVVRNAGNVISDFALGSIEYAVSSLRVPLVMVLGHSGCGAVAGALAGGAKAESALGKIMAEIAPAVEKAKTEAETPQELSALAENYNIRNSLEKLKADPVLQNHPDTLILGAKYDIRTGTVSVLIQE